MEGDRMTSAEIRKADLQEKFLEALVEHRGDMDAARNELNIRKATFYTWLRQDELFRERFESYRLALGAEIENEAVRRVMNPEGQRGSDALATTLLKGLRPERYREKEGGDQNTLIIYSSQLREQPRPGVVLLEKDGALMLPAQGEPDAGHNHAQGHGGSDQPGDSVPE